MLRRGNQLGCCAHAFKSGPHSIVQSGLYSILKDSEDTGLVRQRVGGNVSLELVCIDSSHVLRQLGWSVCSDSSRSVGVPLDRVHGVNNILLGEGGLLSMSSLMPLCDRSNGVLIVWPHSEIQRPADIVSDLLVHSFFQISTRSTPVRIIDGQDEGLQPFLETSHVPCWTEACSRQPFGPLRFKAVV